MKLFCTRDARGQYVLTSKLPIVAELDGTATRDVYVAPGDAVGVRHLCPRVMGWLGIDLARFETIQVDLEIKPAQ